MPSYKTHQPGTGALCPRVHAAEQDCEPIYDGRFCAQSLTMAHVQTPMSPQFLPSLRQWCSRLSSLPQPAGRNPGRPEQPLDMKPLHRALSSQESLFWAEVVSSEWLEDLKAGRVQEHRHKPRHFILLCCGLHALLSPLPPISLSRF